MSLELKIFLCFKTRRQGAIKGADSPVHQSPRYTGGAEFLRALGGRRQAGKGTPLTQQVCRLPPITCQGIINTIIDVKYLKEIFISDANYETHGFYIQLVL